MFSDCSGKLTRWITYINSVRVGFEHHQGVNHGYVDGLTCVYDGEEDISWEPIQEVSVVDTVRGPTGKGVYERI